MFSSHCLERNLDKMLELWTEIFDRVSFRDTERLTTLIRMSAAEQAAMLSHSGHNYAMSHSASSLTPAAKQNEVFGGVTQVRAFQNMYYINNIIKLFTFTNSSILLFHREKTLFHRGKNTIIYEINFTLFSNFRPLAFFCPEEGQRPKI